MPGANLNNIKIIYIKNASLAVPQWLHCLSAGVKSQHLYGFPLCPFSVSFLFLVIFSSFPLHQPSDLASSVSFCSGSGGAQLPMQFRQCGFCPKSV